MADPRGPLSARIARCGHEVKAGRRFCGVCGLEIQLPPVQTEKRPLRKLTLAPSHIAAFVIGAAMLALFIWKVGVPAARRVYRAYTSWSSGRAGVGTAAQPQLGGNAARGNGTTVVVVGPSTATTNTDGQGGRADGVGGGPDKVSATDVSRVIILVPPTNTARSAVAPKPSPTRRPPPETPTPQPERTSVPTPAPDFPQMKEVAATRPGARAFEQVFLLDANRFTPIAVTVDNLVSVDYFRILNWPDERQQAKAARDLNDKNTLWFQFVYSNRDEDHNYKCLYVVSILGDDDRAKPLATDDRTATLDKGKVEDTNKVGVRLKTSLLLTPKRVLIRLEIWKK